LRLAPYSMTVLPRVIPARKDSQSTGWSFLSARITPVCLLRQTAGIINIVPSSAPPRGLASPPCHLTRLLQDKIFLLPSHRIADDCSPDEVRSDKEKKEQGVPEPPGKIVGGQDGPRGSLRFHGGVSQAVEAGGEEVPVMTAAPRQPSPLAGRRSSRRASRLHGVTGIVGRLLLIKPSSEDCPDDHNHQSCYRISRPHARRNQP